MAKNHFASLMSTKEEKKGPTSLDYVWGELRGKYVSFFSKRDSTWYNASLKCGKMIHTLLANADINARIQSGTNYRFDYDQNYRVKNTPTLDEYCAILAALESELNKDAHAYNALIQKAHELDRNDELHEKENLSYLKYLNQEPKELIAVPHETIKNLVRTAIGDEILTLKSYRELHHILWQKDRTLMLSLGVIYYWFELNPNAGDVQDSLNNAANTLANQRAYMREYQANRRAQLHSQLGFGTHNTEVTQHINEYKTSLETINKLQSQIQQLTQTLETEQQRFGSLKHQMESLSTQKSTMSDKQYQQIRQLGFGK